MAMHRRAFIQAGVALTSGSLLAGLATAEAPGQRRLSTFGLQLSTVTQMMLADFAGTLERVAQVGYQQVEFSARGFLGRSASEVQALLTQYGLEAPVGRVSVRLPEGFYQLPRDEAMRVYQQHAGLDRFLDNVRYSLDAALALDQSALVLPALMRDRFTTLDQVKANIELINQAGDLCGAQGVQFGYHNHDWELADLDGVVPYDLMLEQTDPDKVTYQLDAYWITRGGGDLEDYLTRYAGRFSSCHMKDIDDEGDFADVGYGLIDFPRFTALAVAQGARHFFVERDDPPEPLQSIVRSYGYLSQMKF